MKNSSWKEPVAGSATAIDFKVNGLAHGAGLMGESVSTANAESL